MKINDNGGSNQRINAPERAPVGNKEVSKDSAKTEPPADAVAIADSFGTGQVDNSKRVAELKELVARGEYNPPSEGVALAVLRDLA